MVVDSWFGSLWKGSRKNGSDSQKPEKLVVGVLSSEVASVMLKVVHLWRSLSDDEIINLRKEIMSLVGIKKLVSDDEDFLDELVCAEVIENLSFVVKAVARFGRKCTNPVLQRFESVFNDLLENGADLFRWEFSWKKMDKKTMKMEKYIRMTASLYREIEALSDLEFGLSRIQGFGDLSSGNLHEYKKRVNLQRHDVKYLRENSLWNKSYDFVVLLLARSLFTLLRRINHVFGINQMSGRSAHYPTAKSDDLLPRSRSISALRQMSVHPAEDNVSRFSSGPLGRSATKSGPLWRSSTKSGPLGGSTTKSGPLGGSSTKSGPLGRSSTKSGRSSTKSGPIFGTHEIDYSDGEKHTHSSYLQWKPLHFKTKRFTPVGPLKGCIMGGNKSPVLHGFAPVDSSYTSSDGVYSRLPNGTKDNSAESRAHGNILHSILLRYSSRTSLLHAAPSTLGGAALALHYANVIVEIEKFVESPHLIGPHARDDLYSMLPTSIKAALRARLKSYVSNMASAYRDTDLAEEWRDQLVKIIEWLAPLAHNMKRWQSERSFQQHHWAPRTSVLLVQTLFFADQVKAEAAITELLVGLNYLWRFSTELNEKALLECSSSSEIDGYLDISG